MALMVSESRKLADGPVKDMSRLVAYVYAARGGSIVVSSRLRN